jgi:trehalose 6-phosphate phosphatase
MDKTLHWTNHWETIAAKIAQRPRLLLASDFDGTLTPIARTPAEAILPAETRTLLRRLQACGGVHLAIISGRALADVQRHVGIDGLFYVGNHGLELSGPGITLHNPHATKAHGDLERVVAFLVEETASLPGVFVEDKGATAAVHWRLASEQSQEALRELVQVAVNSYPRLRLAEGKCVWELRPREGWNKGHALSHLATRLQLTTEDVLYLGDDVTDEDAFQVAQSGLTFHVGGAGEDTAAHYRLHDAADAQAFLLCLLGIRSGKHACEMEPPPFGVALSPPAVAASLG